MAESSYPLQAEAGDNIVGNPDTITLSYYVDSPVTRELSGTETISVPGIIDLPTLNWQDYEDYTFSITYEDFTGEEGGFVELLNDAGEPIVGAFSFKGDTDTETITLAPPPNITTTSTENGTEISWGSNNASAYEIVFDSVSQNSGYAPPSTASNYSNSSGNLSGTSYTHTGGAQGETYYYSVYPDNSFTLGVKSPEVSQTFSSTVFNIYNVNYPSEIDQGDQFSIEVFVTNDGDANGTQTVTLNINGSTVDSKDFTLNSGSTTSKSLYWDTSGEEGNYTIAVSTNNDSISRTVTVSAGYNMYIDGTQVKDITIDGETINSISIDGVNL